MRGACVVVLGAAALLLRAPAFADDAPMSLYGGTARTMDESEVSVSMDSETVLLSLERGGYEVRVDFRFFNHGASTTMPVGFPVVAPTGFQNGPLPITDFATWVDGVRREVRELDSAPADAAKYAPPDALSRVSAIPQSLRWLVADLPFPGGKPATVRVRYRAAYDPDPPWDAGAHYLFGTGAAWKGPIGNALFIVDRGSQTRVPNVQFTGVGAARPWTLRLGRYTTAYRFAAIEPPPTASLEVSFPGETREETQARGGDGDERPRVAAYEDWRFVREAVKDRDLEGLTPRELRIFRNFFYAGHGRIFADPELRSLFQSCSWYRPRPDFKESDLSPVEAANVRRIWAREDLLIAGVKPGGAFEPGDLRYPVSSGRRLLDALDRGDLAAVRKELEPLKSPEDAAYLLPADALLKAVRSGQLEALKMLLDAGADVDRLDQAALSDAACAGRDDALALLLAPKTRVTAVAFDFRCGRNFRQTLSPEDAGTTVLNPGSWMILLKRFAAGPRARSEDGPAVLRTAARYGWADGVNALLRAGVADAHGDALDAAAWRGDLKAARLLTGEGRESKENLNGALLSALLKRHADVATALLDLGADVNAEDGIGRTPLIVAAWSNDPELIDLVLDRGAVVSAKNRDGWTALREAKSRRLELSVSALRARGATD